MLHDTVSPTMLQAGIRVNVIPSEARGNINIRQIPGNLITELISKLTQLVNDPQVRFELQPGSGEAAPNSSLYTELYRTIVKATPQSFPGADVIPFMSPGQPIPTRFASATSRPTGDSFPLQEYDFLRMHPTTNTFPLIRSTKASTSSTPLSTVSGRPLTPMTRSPR